MIERRFVWMVLVLVAVMGTVQVVSVRQETQTWDEGILLAAGYSYLQTGDYRIDKQHPPLGKLLNALPLLFLHPDLPLSDRSWKQSEDVDFGRAFLYNNRVPADKMLAAARSAPIAFTLIWAVILAWWTKRRFGTNVALLALCLFVFDPNVIAHGRYVTTDIYMAGFTFFSCAAWSEYLRKPSPLRLMLAGAMLGLALASKGSSLFLPPVLLILYIVYWWRAGKPTGWVGMVRGLAVSLSVAMAVALGVVMLTSFPELKAGITYLISGRKELPFLSHPLADRLYTGTAVGKALFWIARELNLPTFAYLVSLDQTWNHVRTGHQSYLLGMLSSRGWWYYFPVAVLVKTPTATLGLFGVSLVAGIAGARQGIRSFLREVPFECYAMAIPAALFLAISMTQNLNIGLRHILCVYPLAFVFFSWMLVSAGRPWLGRAFVPVAGLLVVGLVIESLAIFPDYLAFFNIASGGPGNGPHYLLDSNIDWGQDLKKLKVWYGDRPDRLATCYFGNALHGYYGLKASDLPEAGDSESWETVDGFAAVSVTPLFGLYNSPERFARLRKLRPIAKIGYSIYVYDLRKGTGPPPPDAPLPDAPPPDPTLPDPMHAGAYNDSNPAIHYTGNWGLHQQFPQARDGDVAYTSVRGESFQFRFTGTGITYVYTKAFNRGIALISIDGATQGMVDLYSQDIEWQSQTRFANLSPGKHRLLVQVTGRKNPKSTDYFVDVDALIVE